MNIEHSAKIRLNYSFNLMFNGKSKLISKMTKLTEKSQIFLFLICPDCQNGINFN